MKNIFSRFVAKSLLGLSLIVAPAVSFAVSFDALGTAVATQSSLNVYWDASTVPAGVNSYRVAYRVSGSSYWYYSAWSPSALVAFSPYTFGVGGNSRYRSVTGLQVGTAYDFMVWGMTGGGTQYGSDVVYGSTAAQTSTTPCYKPTDVWGEYVCSYCEGSSATVSFQVDGGNFNSGRISWGAPNVSATQWTGFYNLNMMTTPTGTLTFTGLQIPDGMSFRVGISCSSSSELTWSNIYTLNGSGCARKQGQMATLAAPILSVYPNPSNGAFRLTLNGALETASELNVLDLNGKTVLTQTVESNETEATVDMTGKAAGVYFLKFNGETKKIVLR